MFRVHVSLCLLGAVACGGASSGSDTTPTPPTSGAPASMTTPVKRTIHGGETLEGILAGGEAHEFTIDLAAKAAVTFQISGRADDGCPYASWNWRWYGPHDEFIEGRALGEIKRGGVETRQRPADLSGEVPGIGTVMAPLAGTYRFELERDHTCWAPHYEITLIDHGSSLEATAEAAAKYGLAIFDGEQACRAEKNPKACFDVGVIFIEGRGMQKNTLLGMAFLKEGCRQKHEPSCELFKSLEATGLTAGPLPAGPTEK